MKNMKRGLASILAVWMLISALPVTALAAEESEGQETDPILTQEEPGGLEERAPEEEDEAEEETPDEVVYNLLDNPVTVGSDADRESEYGYDLFDSNGDYTIVLEDNAFFPYEVQFTYEGDTWEEWFMDPDDTVTVGGHAFSVTSAQTDPTALTQIGVTVGGEYIPAYPEEKDFSEMPSISPMSLLPLTERYFELDMQGYFEEELKQVAVSAVLADHVTPEAEDLVVWAKGSSDDFSIIGQDGVLDLSPINSYNSSVSLDLIVGNADQLDMDNTLYNVTVRVSPENDLLTGSAYTADGQEIPLISNYYSSENRYVDDQMVSSLDLEADADSGVWDGTGEARVKLAMNNQDFAALSAEAYAGYYFTLEELESAIAAGTARNITEEMLGAGTGYLTDYTQSANRAFTIRWLRDGAAVAVRPLYVWLRISGDSWSYSSLENAEGRSVSNWGNSYYDNAQRANVREFTAREGYAVDDTYFFGMTFNHNGRPVEDATQYVKSFVGYYASLEDADGQPDVTEALFGDGYQADYSGAGVTFSIFRKDGSLLTRVKIVLLPYEPEVASEPEPGREDTYFHVDGASKQGGDGYGSGEYRAWGMPADVDGYYYGYPDGDLNFGCQTVFLLDGLSPVEDAEIYPEFTVGNGVKAYAGHDGASGVEQVSQVSSVPFVSGEAIKYSAASGNTALKNYWVTFVTQQEGPKLYVNAANVKDTWDEETGLPVREVYLDSFHDYHHDVFFANIGNEELQGLSVTLENAQNVQLDEYWTIREGSVAKLAAFDSTYSMDNIAKIRLEPIRDENGNVQAGEVSGTLVIKADMGTPADPSDDQEVRIQLLGTAGMEKITTNEIVEGVKYVPYASVIQTNVMGSSNAVRFELASGSLPRGITLFENGKIYGVPQESGTFTFTVRANFEQSGRTETKTFTMTILTNSDTNVDAATDMGYELLDRVPAEMDDYTDQVFRSSGEYGQFYKFYLDGQELVEGQDFDSEEGSTKITIRAQTFQNAGGGTHTIAAEFRTNKSDTNTVKRAAQNYTVSRGSSGSSSSASKPAINHNANTSGGTPTTADIFWDVSASDWFYADVDWAYQQKLMIGVTEQTYAPYGPISPATVVTVLARMDKVDLTAYAQANDARIDAGQWYTAAANWAMQSGLLPDEHFTAQPPIARAKVAVMLVKYLQHSGIDCTLPATPVAFADAELMTQEENEAFQVLYQFGIFKGIGNYYMDPQGSTTRAQLAVLLHRMSVFAENQK